MEKISKDNLALLKEQGLEADIRNKLGVVKNMPALLKAYKKEENIEKKEKIFQYLDLAMQKLEENVNHICNSFVFFDIKLKDTHE